MKSPEFINRHMPPINVDKAVLSLGPFYDGEIDKLISESSLARASEIRNPAYEAVEVIAAIKRLQDFMNTSLDDLEMLFERDERDNNKVLAGHITGIDIALKTINSSFGTDEGSKNALRVEVTNDDETIDFHAVPLALDFGCQLGIERKGLYPDGEKGRVIEARYVVVPQDHELARVKEYGRPHEPQYIARVDDKTGEPYPMDGWGTIDEDGGERHYPHYKVYTPLYRRDALGWREYVLILQQGIVVLGELLPQPPPHLRLDMPIERA